MALAGFGGVQPTDFAGTAGISIYDPERRGGGPRRPSPWDEPRKGEPGFGGTPTPTPTEEPTPEPESQPQTFFERFPTPQDAWKDWLSRMGKFLARQPGEVPNFPGPWGAAQTSDEARQAAAQGEVRGRREIAPSLISRHVPLSGAGGPEVTFRNLFTP